jgi:hypothetical protein
MKADPAAIGPEATPEGAAVYRTEARRGILYFPTNIAGPTLGLASKASTEPTDPLIQEAVGLDGAEGRLEAPACCG